MPTSGLSWPKKTNLSHLSLSPLVLSKQICAECRGAEGREHVSVHAHVDGLLCASCGISAILSPPQLDLFTPDPQVKLVMQYAPEQFASRNRLLSCVSRGWKPQSWELNCCVLASNAQSGNQSDYFLQDISTTLQNTKRSKAMPKRTYVDQNKSRGQSSRSVKKPLNLHDGMLGLYHPIAPMILFFSPRYRYVTVGIVWARPAPPILHSQLTSQAPTARE